MQLRPEVWPKVATSLKAPTREQSEALAAFNTVGVHQIYSRVEDRTVWSWLDEPGTFREIGTGRVLREDEIPVGVITPEQQAARRLAEDRQMVAQHLGKALAQGQEVEDRGGYRLLSCGNGLFTVETLAGVPLTPGPVGEEIAREVLALLSPEAPPPPSITEELDAKAEAA